MAGGTLARTPHFALHCVALTAAEQPRSGLSGPDTAAVQRKMQSRHAPPLFEKTGVWMGAMVPKRWAKRAVTRNAIKRQIYSASALAEIDLSDAAHVVRLRAGFDIKTFPSATSDALKKAVCLELTQLFANAVHSSNKKVPRLAEQKGSHAGPRAEPLEAPQETTHGVPSEAPSTKGKSQSEEAIAKRAMTIR